MRKYNSETDYEILAKYQEKEMSLVNCKYALLAVGIEWPNLNGRSSSPEAEAIDKDLLRSWKRR